LTGQVAERAGWQIVRVYKDHGISGAKSKDKRPETPCSTCSFISKALTRRRRAAKPCSNT
jgi:hypothetical protein